jgi:hypothetical protein
MHAMWARLLLVAAGVTATMGATIAPAFATVTEVSGNTNPASQNADGRCTAGQHWVYVSPNAETTYNPLAKTTDNLGANLQAPPNANADAFNDGVTVTLTDSTHASFSVNEATDPLTLITVTKLVVKAGNHYTIFTANDLTQNTPRSSPNGGTNLMGVSHAFVCYSLTSAPPPDVPEFPYPAVLAGAGVAVGATILVLRRRLRAA